MSDPNPTPEPQAPKPTKAKLIDEPSGPPLREMHDPGERYKGPRGKPTKIKKRKSRRTLPPAGDPKRPLTAKEHRLVKAYADPKSSTFGNGAQSAIKAHYTRKSPAKAAHQAMSKSNVRLALVKAIHAHGGTLDLTGKRLAEGLSAHQTRVFLSKRGKLVYSDELVDFDQRRKYAEIVARFEGALPSPQEQERIALLQIQQTFNLVPPVDPKPQDIEIEGTVEE